MSFQYPSIPLVLLAAALVASCQSLPPAPTVDARPNASTAGSATDVVHATPTAAFAPQEQAPAPPPAGVAEPRWGFLIKPYFFACGLKGTVGTGKDSTDIDASFTDLLDALNFGGMLALEAKPPASQWTILADLMYVQLEDDGITRGPVGVDANANIDQFVGELSAAYEVIDQGRLEVLGGVRYWNVAADLTAALPGGPRSASGSADWFDPLVGLRSRLQLGSKFDLRLRGDLGGFGVGSDFAYNLAAEVGWSISDTFQLALGYRYLSVDYEDNATYDVDMAGPTLGLGIRF